MQKKLNFVKINKLAAAFGGIVMLLFLIFISGRAVPSVKSTNYHNTPVAASMYKQLKNVAEVQTSPNSKTPEMNNLFFENSNTAINTDTSTFPQSVRLLDAKTGAVSSVDIEYYTLCSLIAEMPQSFDAQALMAQAVACRTFAVRNAITGAKHNNADICTDYRCCQSMIDADTAEFDITKAKEAVLATRGIIAVYGGEPILAAYHSSSIGYTNSSAEVWGGELDYLVPVAAAEDKEDTKSTSNFSKVKVKSALKKYGLNDDIQFLSLQDGICTGAVSGSISVSPKQIQNALSLRSDTFKVHKDKDDYVFTCYGFGHGVGMSQYGADALAKQGYDFYEILKYYYTGISFDFIA